MYPAMKFGLAEKLSLFVALLILCGSIIIGSVFYYNSGTYLVNKELDSFGHLLLKEEQRITGIIQEPRDDVLFISNVPPIQGIIRTQQLNGSEPKDGSTEEQWKYRLETIFTELIKAKPNYLQIRYIGVADGGREIVRVEKQADNTIKTIRGKALQKKGEYLYFRESILIPKTEIYLSKIEFNREHGKIAEPHVPVLRIAKPILNPDGRVFGIVVINMDLSLILTAGLDENFKNRNNYYVVNESGDFLVHPDATKTFGFDLGQRHTIQQTFPILSEALLTNGVSKSHGTRYINNGEIIYFYKVFVDKYKLNKFIGLVYVKSYKSVISNIVGIIKNSVFWTILFLIFGVTFSFFVARFQLKKIGEVTLAINEFSKGSRDFKLPDAETDEVGILAHAFQKMARKYDEHEKSLKESESHVQAIIETVTDSIFIIDDHNLIVSSNPSVKKLFGYSQYELVGQDINILIDEPVKNKNEEYFNEFDSTGELNLLKIQEQISGKRKDGSTFPLKMLINEMDVEGEDLFVVVIRDISEQIKWEQELLNYRDNLQEMVDVQTLDLIEARDDALAAERAMSGFLANMSHEFRTPLHGIISYSKFGLKKTGNVTEEKVRGYFSEIHESGEHLLGLVDGLLDLSKLRAGKMVYVYKDENPALIIDKVIHEFEILSTEKEINIVFEDASADKIIKLDRIKFSQVIRNLISNALKFSLPGTTIEVFSDYIDKSNMYEVRVCNLGIGIPKGEEEFIFEPFSQSSYTSTGAGGTGLGLPICREIITKGHGGSIQVETFTEGVTCLLILIPVT